MSSRFQLNGKRVAVLGAAGRVGRGICRSVAALGGELVLLDRDRVGLAALRAALDASAPVHEVIFDVADMDRIAENIEAIEGRCGPFDVWVNSSYPRGGEDGSAASRWRTNIDLHLGSYCLAAEEVARRMAERGGGSLVNLSSVHGGVVAPDFSVYEGTQKFSPSHYSAVKGGIVAHSRWLASYYGGSKVRVNVVCPGGVFNEQTDPFLRRYNAQTMLGRMARDEEIGDAVAFLASDASSYITGVILPVDGGLTAR